MVERLSDFTPFGREVYSWMKERKVAPNTLLKLIGVPHLDRFMRFLQLPSSMITLEFVFHMSYLTEKSPVTLLRFIYEDQQVAVNLPEETRERYIRFLLLFDRFFRLQKQGQDTVLLLCQSFHEKRQRSVYSESELDFLQFLKIEQDRYLSNPRSLQAISERAMANQGLSHVKLGAMLGVGPFYIKRLFLRTTVNVPLSKSVYLPILLQAAVILKVSPIRLFLLLYLHYEPEERMRECFHALEDRYYALFSRFYQLEEEQQDALITMTDALVHIDGARTFSPEHLAFINNFRVQPFSARRKLGDTLPK